MKKILVVITTIFVFYSCNNSTTFHYATSLSILDEKIATFTYTFNKDHTFKGSILFEYACLKSEQILDGTYYQDNEYLYLTTTTRQLLVSKKGEIGIDETDINPKKDVITSFKIKGYGLIKPKVGKKDFENSMRLIGQGMVQRAKSICN
jgi:hypothetical protein